MLLEFKAGGMNSLLGFFDLGIVNIYSVEGLLSSSENYTNESHNWVVVDSESV